MTSGLHTRKPTGHPAWPLILLAGKEKAGKSWAAAEATNSPLIRDAYWLAVGEDDPDELGRIGNFSIVEHDGSYHSIMGALHAIAALDQDPQAPDLIILDSISMVWVMLTDEAQALANRRAADKARKSNRPAPTDDVTIGMDLWNRAAKRWRRMIDALRAHRGPVIVTARLSQVSVLDKRGEPVLGEKEWKIEGHKTLPFDVTAIIQLRSRSERYITGVRSVVWQTADDALIPFPAERGVADLWAKLGIESAADGVHRAVDGSASVTTEDRIREDLIRRLRAVTTDWERLERWWDGQHQEALAEASDLHALMQLVEQGEAKAREHQARIAQVDQLPIDRESRNHVTAAQPAQPPSNEGENRAAPAQPAQPPSRYRQARASQTDQTASIEAQRHTALASHIAIRMGDLDITQRDERLFYTAQLAGLDSINSTKDLTVDQMRDVLSTLEAMATRDDLEAHLQQKDQTDD